MKNRNSRGDAGTRGTNTMIPWRGPSNVGWVSDFRVTHRGLRSNTTSLSKVCLSARPVGYGANNAPNPPSHNKVNPQDPVFLSEHWAHRVFWPKSKVNHSDTAAHSVHYCLSVQSSSWITAHGIDLTSRIGCPHCGIESVALGIGSMDHPADCLVTTYGPGEPPARGWAEGQSEGQRFTDQNASNAHLLVVHALVLCLPSFRWPVPSRHDRQRVFAHQTPRPALHATAP